MSYKKHSTNLLNQRYSITVLQAKRNLFYPQFACHTNVSDVTKNKQILSGKYIIRKNEGNHQTHSCSGKDQSTSVSDMLSCPSQGAISTGSVALMSSFCSKIILISTQSKLHHHVDPVSMCLESFQIEARRQECNFKWQDDQVLHRFPILVRFCLLP